MKRVAKITADDGQNKVKIVIEVKTKETLMDAEAALIVQGLVRGCADGIRGVVYTDFGVENTKVIFARK